MDNYFVDNILNQSNQTMFIATFILKNLGCDISLLRVKQFCSHHFLGFWSFTVHSFYYVDLYRTQNQQLILQQINYRSLSVLVYRDLFFDAVLPGVRCANCFA